MAHSEKMRLTRQVFGTLAAVCSLKMAEITPMLAAKAVAPLTVYISLDMEGVAGIVTADQLSRADSSTNASGAT